MQVQVNTRKAVSAITAFMESHGGNAKHSEVLELLAQVCGFHTYRAMAAVTGESARGTKAPVPSAGEGHTIESQAAVVFRAAVQDWNKEERAGRPTYDFIVENHGENFRVLMKPQGTDLDNFPGRAVLDVNFEVNEGVPCAHMTNDSADAMALSVFGTGGGLLVRPDDGEWMAADSVGVPAVLGELAQQACAPRELHKAYAAVIDTEAKYREEPYPARTVRERAIRQYAELCVKVALDDTGLSRSNQAYRQRSLENLECELTEADRSEANRRVSVVLSNKTETVSGAKLSPEKKAALPGTRTEVNHPIRRKDIGTAVEVQFDDSIDVMGEHLWVTVEQRQRNGLVDEDSRLVLPTSYAIGTPPQVLRVVADNLSHLAAFFISAGYALDQETILGRIAEASAPHVVSRACVDLAESAPDKHTAYQQVLDALKAVR